jgi:hypothetical protein
MIGPENKCQVYVMMVLQNEQRYSVSQLSLHILCIADVVCTSIDLWSATLSVNLSQRRYQEGSNLPTLDIPRH